MPDFDDKFVDVDFTREPDFVFGDLGQRRFGVALPSYEAAEPPIPESQWPALIEAIDNSGGHIEALIVEIFNQQQEGSCVSNATAQAHQICQALQYGKENVIELSAISLYKRVARSPGAGSMLSDNLDELASRGILPLDTAKNRQRFGAHVMPNTGFFAAYPSGWETTAALFKGHEAFNINTLEGLVSASLRGWPVVVGRQGHSICYVRPTYKNGRIAFYYANSWGDWGGALGDFTSGFGLDTIGLVQQSASWAFALRSVHAPQVA